MNNQPVESRIKVLIVDDSAFMRMALARMVAHDPSLQVVGSAANGTEALQKIVTLDPDVVTLDVEMPGPDGLETLRCIMALLPRPVIMVSSVTLQQAEITFDALSAGAFDYVPKQLSPNSLDIRHIREELVAKIKGAAESWHSRNRLGLLRKPPHKAVPRARKVSHSAPAIVALGVSTGGPKALQEMLPTLPVDLPFPILIVQHMPVGFTAAFAKRLNSLCAVSVCEARQGDLVRPGVIYLAPTGFQMTVNRPSNSRTVICLSIEPENQMYIPSVDVTMESVASAFHSQAMGIIMTGMGSDGAQGMKAIHQEGGLTVGQDEPSCAVYGMPRVCAEMGILNRVVPLSQIPYEILQATRFRKTNVT
jgi:two-component system, chemotaxis family, protein-glutamate methylesterase/glutaminase